MKNTSTYTAKLVNHMTKKNKEYTCLEIAIHPTYTKKVFLDESDSALITALNQTQFTVTVGQGFAKETGNPYHTLDIQLTTECTKKAFLNRSELALIKLTETV